MEAGFRSLSPQLLCDFYSFQEGDGGIGPGVDQERDPRPYFRIASSTEFASSRHSVLGSPQPPRSSAGFFLSLEWS